MSTTVAQLKEEIAAGEAKIAAAEAKVSDLKASMASLEEALAEKKRIGAEILEKLLANERAKEELGWQKEEKKQRLEAAVAEVKALREEVSQRMREVEAPPVAPTETLAKGKKKPIDWQKSTIVIASDEKVYDIIRRIDEGKLVSPFPSHPWHQDAKHYPWAYVPGRIITHLKFIAPDRRISYPDLVTEVGKDLRKGELQSYLRHLQRQGIVSVI